MVSVGSSVVLPFDAGEYPSCSLGYQHGSMVEVLLDELEDTLVAYLLQEYGCQLPTSVIYQNNTDHRQDF